MDTIGAYVFDELLHESRRTTVRRGRRTSDGLPVVAKILTEARSSTTDLARFAFAYELTCDLDIPGVARALDLLDHEGQPVLVTEDVGGRDLRELAEAQAFSIEDSLEVGIAISRTLGELHQAQIIHNDIKPSNIVLDRETGRAQLIDFDHSSTLSHELVEAANSPSIEGTLSYCSPEQTGRTTLPVDYRTDFYSLGATLYELLARRLPFETTDALTLVHCHLAVVPEPLHLIAPPVPEAVSQIVLKLLAKDPNDRYQSAFGIETDLQHCLDALRSAGAVEPFPLAARDVSARFQVAKRIYGRDEDIAALVDTLERVAREQPELVLLSGAAGVGKTALVRAFQQPMVARRATFLTGKFDQLTNTPYAGWVRAFSQLTRDLLAESPSELQQSRERILAALGPIGRVVTDVVPDLVLLIGAQPELPELAPSEASARLQHAFTSLVGAVASRERPLVLFVDDLQWAGTASLRLLESFLKSPEITGLLVIGAFRDAAVDAAHPVSQTAESLRNAGVGVTSIVLAPLDANAVTSFVADTVCASAEECAPLAAEVRTRTNGNPFFVDQLLRAIHEQGALQYDNAEGRWRWDLDAIQSLGITDNVADLLANKLGGLPAQTRDAVQFAACVGGRFDLSTLSRVTQISPGKLAGILWPALEAEVIVPIGAAWRLAPHLRDDFDDANRPGNLNGRRDVPARAADGVLYRFPHDQVQRVAIESLSSPERAARHRRVGQLLLAALGDPNDPDERRFEAVDQLNAGREAIERDDERHELAKLNLFAATAAHSSAAHGKALEYATTGLSCLDEAARQSHRELFVGLHREAAEVIGDIDGMRRHLSAVEPYLETNLERAAFVAVEVREHLAHHEEREAVAKALDCLELLGITLPRRPRAHHVASAMFRSWWSLRNLSDEDILAIPETTNPEIFAAGPVLTALSTAAYFVDPLLYPLVSLKQLELSLAHGNTRLAIGGLLGYSLLQIGVFDGRATANRYADLCLKLCEHPHNRAGRPVVSNIINNVVRHWRDPMRGLLEPLLDAYQEAREIGDVYFAGLSAVVRLNHSLLCGVPLPEIEKELRAFSDAMADQTSVFRMLEGCGRVCAALRGTDEADTHALRRDRTESEQAELSALDGTSRGGFHTTCAMLNVLLDHPERAVSEAKQAWPLQRSMLGAPHIPALHFYFALAQLQALPKGRRARRRALQAVRSSQKKLHRWAELAPENYAHKVDLIEAERVRAVGPAIEGTDLFSKAVRSARISGVLHDEALANELAGRFHLANDHQTIGRAYMAEAHARYVEWGANAIVERLRARYPWLETVGASDASDTSSNSLTSDLDLQSILQASQLISSEIILERLSGSLLETMAQNAGAERATLLLPSDGQLAVVAQIRDAREPAQLIAGLPIDEASGFAASVVRFVERSTETLVLGNATSNTRFGKDRHISSHGIQSILCMPIRSQGKLVGVVYLENRHTTDAFSPERANVLGALTGQVAISLDNARLYSDLESSLRNQQALTTAQGRFVPDQFLQALGRDDIRDISLGDHAQKELSVLVSDIRGFTTLIESLTPEASIEFINTYISYMEPAITDHGGFIDSYIGDEIMALFDTDADHALEAAIEMMRGLHRLNERRAGEGKDPVKVGIGINTGQLMLGAIGTPHRVKCGVIGDGVNLASRVEMLTKQYDVSILISEDTYARLANPDRYHIRMLERVRVAGRVTPVTLYEVFDGDSPEIFEIKSAIQARFVAGAELYHAGNPEGALRVFYECASHSPHDRSVESYIERCRGHIERGLPAEWDGVDRSLAK